MRHAVIIAGGAGKRLWPASRLDRPKQLIPLVDGKCLLEVTLNRLTDLFPPERTLVVAGAGYADEICSCYPGLPRENVIGEPEGRDTANAIGLAAEIIGARDSEATMAVFTADHIIKPQEEFRAAIELACEAAESNPEALVTFGIRPKSAHTGLGYIHCGERVGDSVRQVLGFKEKPNHHTARFYFESGEYFWNSGMFVWRVETILKAMAEFLPAAAGPLANVGKAVAAGEDITELLKRIYPSLPKISIDYAIMEKARTVMMVELPCYWQDVGSWPALADVVKLDADDNAVIAGRAAMFDSTRNVVYSSDDHLVAVVGMEDCIIVHTDNATLVCNKNDSQRLKELLEMISTRFGPGYI